VALAVEVEEMTKKERRQHGDGSIFQRGDGRWYGAYEVPGMDGKRRRKTVSHKRRDVVVKRLRELRKDIDTGNFSTSPTTTVAAWLQHWITTVRGPQVRPKTRAWYDQSCRCHIVPQIGSQRLDRLTPEHVRQMIAAIQQTGSTASAQQAHTTLRTALKDAVDEGLVARNVAAMVRRPKHAAKVRHEFTFEQAKSIIAAALEYDDQVWAARVMLAFMTGARPGELLGLRWDYVDLDKAQIELAWQLQQLSMEHGCGGTCGRSRPGYCPEPRYVVPPGFQFEPCYRSLAFTPVKTKAGNRVVPLLPVLADLLREMYTADSNNPAHLVFHHADGRPYAPKEDYDMWKALLRRAGLPPDSVGYQSRHTTATLLRRFGVDDDLRMAIMGHSSVVAHRGYLHADADEKRQALAPLAALTTPGD
jgi:integrase